MIRSSGVLRRYLGMFARCALVAGFFGPAANSAHAIPLADLFGGETPETIVAGDKLFSNWQLVTNAAGTDLSQIDVTPLDDPASNPGLRYTDTGGALTLDTLGEEFQISFRFTVTVLDPTQRISGNTLELVDAATEGFALVQILEGVDDGTEDTILATKIVTSQGEPVIDDPLAEATFAPQQSIGVSTILFGVVEGAEDFGRLTQFDQRFSQVSIAVPEPASLGVFLAGLAGLGFFSRFPHRAKAGRRERRA